MTTQKLIDEQVIFQDIGIHEQPTNITFSFYLDGNENIFFRIYYDGKLRTKEIKRRLKPQPQPDELVEKLLKIGMRAEVDGLNYADTLENKPAKMLKIFDEARAEIRTLLQSVKHESRQPVVTMGEIETLVCELSMMAIDDTNTYDDYDMIELVVDRLKSIGVEVRGE